MRQIAGIFLFLLLGMFAGSAAFIASGESRDLHLASDAGSVWFDADMPRVFDNLTDRRSDHYRVSVHPNFSIIGWTSVRVIQQISGLDPDSSVRIYLAAVAFLWAGLLWLTLRFAGLPHLTAAALTAVGISSSAFLFWFTVPETYGLGSLSIVAMFCAFAGLQQRERPGLLDSAAFVVLSAFSLAVTTTNWVVGLVASLLRFTFVRAVVISALALFGVLALWSLQSVLFENTGLFLVPIQETRFIAAPSLLGPLDVVLTFLVSTVVMPMFVVNEAGNWAGWSVLSLVGQAFNYTSVWGWVALLAWLGLVVLSTLHAKNVINHRFGVLVGLFAASQLLLHLVYGSEPFLYVAHWLPALILLVGLTAGRSKPVLTGLLSAGLAVTALANNSAIYSQAVTASLAGGDARATTIAAMRERPDDPWPRGEGHVFLANPGSAIENKGIHEPGGDFSPRFGSFGVSFAVRGDSGSLTHSGSIPMGDVQQSLGLSAETRAPQIRTRTPAYDVLWRALPAGAFRLAYQPKESGTHEVHFRGVGPAGGPVSKVERIDDSLFVLNDSWRVELDQTAEWRVGVENAEQGLSTGRNESAVLSDTGWGYLSLVAPASGLELSLVPLKRFPDETACGAEESLRLEGGEQSSQFRNSLSSQINHMRMGLVGDETRPGDPIAYPYDWARDGAFVVVALARAGLSCTARELALQLAEEDFFGGFGAEADAPGLVMWAMDQASRLVGTPEFDAQLERHFLRKAQLIVDMATTKRRLHFDFRSPVVPKLDQLSYSRITRVAQPSARGTIRGKMDNGWRELYSTAVGYLGLRSGSEFFARQGQTPPDQWRLIMEQLQLGFVEVANQRASDPRDVIAAPWPSQIVAADSQAASDLRASPAWRKADTLVWPYFKASRAAQSLAAGDTEAVWNSLKSLWLQQSSPGLYTWSEGVGEENNHHTWKEARGWVRPDGVTPHYWVAATLSLLQMDMLASSNAGRPIPTITVGSGIPSEWYRDGLSVCGLAVGSGRVDMALTEGQLMVDVVGVAPGDVNVVKADQVPEAIELLSGPVSACQTDDMQ